MSVDLDHLTMLHAFAEQEPSDSSDRFEQFATAVFEEWDSLTEELHELRRQRYVTRLFPIMRTRHTSENSPSIPIDMLLPHEGQALTNHQQSLRALSARGGLSECEALAVLEDRPFRKMSPDEARAKLEALVRTWTEDVHRREIDRLKRELNEARLRLLSIADYDDVDAGEKTLDECVSLVALEIDCEYEQRVELEKKLASQPSGPVDLILHCPKCGKQHLDTGEWIDRAHKTHLCKDTQEGPDTGCGHLWKPSALPTRGVAQLAGAGA